MAFPAVTLLDSFIRAAEGNLFNGGKWKIIQGLTAPGQINTEAWGPKSASPLQDGAYWTLLEYGSPAVALELHVSPGAERWAAVWACLQSPGTINDEGYRVRLLETKAAPLEYTLLIERVKGEEVVVLAETKKLTIAVGDRFGISVVGGKVSSWRKTGAGAWTLVNEVADTTWTSGFVGLSGVGNGGRYRNFEVGGNHLHTLTASQGQTATLAQAQSHVLTVSQTQSGTVRPTPGRVLSAAQPQAATLTAVVEGHAHSLSTSQPQSATLRRDLSRSLAVTAAPAASVSTGRLRTLFATVFSEATLTAVIEAPPPPPPPPITVGTTAPRSAVVHNLISTR